MRYCTYCKEEVVAEGQFCVSRRIPNDGGFERCNPERVYVGFNFIGLPEEARKYYLALRDAKFEAYQFGCRVVIETEDIAAITDIYHRVVDDSAGIVRGDCLRLNDEEVAKMEIAHATEQDGKHAAD